MGRTGLENTCSSINLFNVGTSLFTSKSSDLSMRAVDISTSMWSAPQHHGSIHSCWTLPAGSGTWPRTSTANAHNTDACSARVSMPRLSGRRYKAAFDCCWAQAARFTWQSMDSE
eukprot:2590878-Alexandrium_andersonii.AAC.1